MTRRRQKRGIHAKHARQRTGSQARDVSSAAPDRRPRVLAFAVAITALALLLTIDDRYPGAIADGRQMAWTAIAMSETGEIGQARGRDFTWARPHGDAVSRYGMAMSFAQVPAAWLAPRVEATLGPGTSQPLFLIAPLFCVCIAAAAAGWIVLLLGSGAGAIVAAVVLTALGSPLGSYASLDLSEPLQAASLSVTLGCAVAATGSTHARIYAFAGGFAAGIAVLTKSSLWLAVPFALLPILTHAVATRSTSNVLWTMAGLVVPAGAWAYLEVTRFDSLFASYPGEGFTHSFVDGLWRLVVGPNRGLLLYFPALALAVAAVVASRSRPALTRATIVASLGLFGALLGTAAGWWAWHGLWGWGPRLLVPGIPPLAASAAILLERWPSSVRIAVLAASIIINLPGLAQNAAPVTLFTSSCEWPIADTRFANALAPYARRAEANGQFRVAPDQLLEIVPSASPFLVYPWFASAASGDLDDAMRRLAAPPWRSARPDIRCGPTADRGFIQRLMRRLGWPVWGRGFWPDRNAPGFPGVYDEGLLDQVVRAQQLGRAEQALVLARKLARLRPEGEADAYVLESLRLLRRRTDAVEYLSGLSQERRSQPKINIVLALFERDAGNEPLARNLLGSVASAFPGTPVQTAIASPLGAWPPDLDAMTRTATDQATPPGALK